MKVLDYNLKLFVDNYDSGDGLLVCLRDVLKNRGLNTDWDNNTRTENVVKTIQQLLRYDYTPNTNVIQANVVLNRARKWGEMYAMSRNNI